jgi:hypothetical protein
MRLGHQRRAGIGDRRRAGLGEQAHVAAGQRRLQQGGDGRSGVCSFSSAMATSRIGFGWPQAARKRRADFAFSTTNASSARMRSSTGPAGHGRGIGVLREPGGQQV